MTLRREEMVLRREEMEVQRQQLALAEAQSARPSISVPTVSSFLRIQVGVICRSLQYVCPLCMSFNFIYLFFAGDADVAGHPSMQKWWC